MRRRAVYVKLDGEKVRAMRESNAGVFAKEAGISAKTLRRVERGETVSVKTARKIAAALEVEPPQSLARPR
jgi:predicted transcriptional regulator